MGLLLPDSFAYLAQLKPPLYEAHEFVAFIGVQAIFPKCLS
jgi:hypothetical protein